MCALARSRPRTRAKAPSSTFLRRELFAALAELYADADGQPYDVGDRSERSIASIIGNERAHALRTIADSWNAAWGTVGTCVDE